jgi:hypothetical protein
MTDVAAGAVSFWLLQWNRMEPFSRLGPGSSQPQFFINFLPVRMMKPIQAMNLICVSTGWFEKWPSNRSAAIDKQVPRTGISKQRG